LVTVSQSGQLLITNYQLQINPINPINPTSHSTQSTNHGVAGQGGVSK
jgi:hypothetical protein